MWRSSVVGMAGAMLLLLGGCLSPRRASSQVLVQRASYDLGCPSEQLQRYALDGRTHVVIGCGRRLVYVERCDASLERDACSWLLDTPSFQQTQWPQQAAATQAPRYRPPPPRQSPAQGRERTADDELGF